VSLCQATLSIGPYLLLKVQFQHHNCSKEVPGFKPEKKRLDKQAVGTELPLFISCLEEVFSETGREVICEGVSMYLLLR
jgi:hypothetical protein